MKVVALSQCIRAIPDRHEIQDAIDQRLINFFQAAGFLGAPVPNTFNEVSLTIFLKNISPTAIVLSGGNDVGRYPDRDRTENLMLDYAEAHDLPVLGICRGMQFLAKRAGAYLQPIRNHVAIRHKLDGEICHEVNSYHRYSVSSCPSGFRIIAVSDDKNIEAIRHKERIWEGWMWHPERETTFSEHDVQRVATLFDQ